MPLSRLLPLLALAFALTAAEKSPLVLDTSNRPSVLTAADVIRLPSAGPFFTGIYPTATADRDITLPDATTTLAGLSVAQTFTAAQTIQAAGGITSLQAATQDAVRVLGRAGGSSSHVATITPPTLAGNITITLPAATSALATLALTETLSNKTLTAAGSITATGTVTAPNGTSAAPGIRLTSEASGIYRSASNLMGMAVNGKGSLAIGEIGSGFGGGIRFLTQANADFVYFSADRSDAEMRIAAGTNSADGAGLQMFGSAGANANTGRLRIGTTTIASWNVAGLTLASGENLEMSGASTLVTGTGLSTFNGQVTIPLNVGIGLLPSAWASNHRSIDFGTSNRYASISQQTTSGALFCLTWNGYGTTGDDLWAYKQTGDLASQLTLAGRTLRFRSAVSGTAGSPITWIDSFVVNQSTLTLADSINIVLNTGTGTKIGTATGQKLGFWNAAPVIQPTAVVDATGGATVDTEARAAINALLSRMRTVGMVAP